MASTSRKKPRTPAAPRKRVPVLTFGHRLRMAREMSGLNSTDAGRIIGVSSATISAWERQQWHPRAGVSAAVRVLAEVYEADFDWIMTGTPSSDSVPYGEKPEPAIEATGNPYEIARKEWAGRSGNGDRHPAYADGRVLEGGEQGVPGPRRHLTLAQ